MLPEKIEKGNRRRISMYGGVDYICIGPYERAFADENGFTINEEAFEDTTRFELTYEKEIADGKWQIYEVKTPSSPA